MSEVGGIEVVGDEFHRPSRVWNACGAPKEGLSVSVKFIRNRRHSLMQSARWGQISMQMGGDYTGLEGAWQVQKSPAKRGFERSGLVWDEADVIDSYAMYWLSVDTGVFEY